MAKSNKALVPEAILRDVFITGLREIKRSGIEVRVGNTGTSLVVGVEAWRYCSTCSRVVPVAEIMLDNKTCQKCTITGTGEVGDA